MDADARDVYSSEFRGLLWICAALQRPVLRLEVTAEPVLGDAACHAECPVLALPPAYSSHLLPAKVCGSCFTDKPDAWRRCAHTDRRAHAKEDARLYAVCVMVSRLQKCLRRLQVGLPHLWRRHAVVRVVRPNFVSANLAGIEFARTDSVILPFTTALFVAGRCCRVPANIA